jgi:ribulose-phosphate 3-epimerase
MLRIAPSILNADFGHLADQVRAAEAAGADYIHVDVMDGLFVPNITMGPLVVEAVRRATTLPVDVHLMIERPERYLREFADAGATILTIHVEATIHVQGVLAQVRALGARAGLALCPSTALAVVEEIHQDLDLLLIMTVNPGFGGQKLIPATVGKTARARDLLARLGAAVELEVDGGVNVETAPALVRAGAETLVAGSAVYNAHASVAANLQALRRVAEDAAAAG